MKIYLITIFVAIVSAGPFHGDPPKARIIGGTEGDISKFPYQLSLMIGGRHNCGASVIAKRWALTAAHCLEKMDVNQITLRGGSTLSKEGGTIFEAADYVMHPDYNPRYSDYDVGLIKTKSDMVGENIKVVPLPSFGGNAEIPVGAIATVSGWGYTSAGSGVVAPKIRSVDIPIVDQSKCNQALQKFGGVRGMMFCAGTPGRDACQGDSGGPIVLKGTQIGVVSGGIECGNPDYYGVYTRLSNANVRAFIRNNAKI